jgi:hypothetical protein
VAAALASIDQVVQALRTALLADATLGYQAVHLADRIADPAFPLVAVIPQAVSFEYVNRQRDLATAVLRLSLVNQYPEAEDGERRIRILGDVLRWWLIQHRLLGNLLQGSMVRGIQYGTVDASATDWVHVAELTWAVMYLHDSTQPPVVPPPDPGPDPTDLTYVVQRIIRVGPIAPAKGPTETIQDPTPP